MSAKHIVLLGKGELSIGNGIIELPGCMAFLTPPLATPTIGWFDNPMMDALISFGLR
jgi:hypothetical protein